jgi:hypothetical protein
MWSTWSTNDGRKAQRQPQDGLPLSSFSKKLMSQPFRTQCLVALRIAWWVMDQWWVKSLLCLVLSLYRTPLIGDILIVCMGFWECHWQTHNILRYRHTMPPSPLTICHIESVVNPSTTIAMVRSFHTIPSPNPWKFQPAWNGCAAKVHLNPNLTWLLYSGKHWKTYKWHTLST